MNQERLLQIAEDLKTAENFNMGTWEQERTCGTVRCAIGWHCHLHPNAELKISKIPGETLLFPFMVGTEWGMKSVAAYCGISTNDAAFLFGGILNYGNTAEQVRQQIVDYVASHS